MVPDIFALTATTPAAKPMTLDIRGVGHLHILAGLCGELKLIETINRAIPVDAQVELEPGIGVQAMALNVLGGRAPLYRLQNFYANEVPADLLLGPGVDPAKLNDTALGRLLDRIHRAGCAKVFDTVAMAAIAHEHLDVARTRLDTTSRIMFGEYAHPEGPDLVSVTHGHSKDHRPDLKQVMFGIVTDDDGIPLVGRVLSGNTSDQLWFGLVTEQLRVWLRNDQDGPMRLVGDAALITKDNLDAALAPQIVLTGRLPRSVNACGEAVARAIKNVDGWQQVGPLTESGKGARYQVQHQVANVLGHEVQLAVCSGVGAEKRTATSVSRRAERELQQAMKAAKTLARQKFHCKDDAVTALEHACKHWTGTFLRVDGTVVTEQKKVHGLRGRPRKDAPPAMVEVHHVQMRAVIDDDVVRTAIQENACFVVLHTGKEPRSAEDILREYKGQGAVEKRFPFLKDPAWANACFVKTPEHVEALGYVLLIALLLWTLWERRVRKNLAASGQPPLREATGVKHARPTAMACLHIMAGVRVVRAEQDGRFTAWRLPKPLEPEQARVVRFSAAVPAPALLEAAAAGP